MVLRDDTADYIDWGEAPLKQKKSGYMANNWGSYTQNIKNSEVAVQWVAEQLRNQGMYVKMPKTKIAPSSKQAMKYVDKGDLFTSWDGVTYQRTEVKHLKGWGRFTCAEDHARNIGYYPNGASEPHIMVYAKEAFDKAQNSGKPIKNIILLNQAKTHFVLIYGKDRNKWGIEQSSDNRYKKEDPKYLQYRYIAPLSDVIFKSVTDTQWLKKEV